VNVLFTGGWGRTFILEFDQWFVPWYCTGESWLSNVRRQHSKERGRKWSGVSRSLDPQINSGRSLKLSYDYSQRSFIREKFQVYIFRIFCRLIWTICNSINSLVFEFVHKNNFIEWKTQHRQFRHFSPTKFYY